MFLFCTMKFENEQKIKNRLIFCVIVKLVIDIVHSVHDYEVTLLRSCMHLINVSKFQHNDNFK